MTKLDGGPAFPRSGAPVTSGMQGGMSLRDWFAGQAAAAMIGDSEYAETFTTCARDAYLLADAMIAQRDKLLEKA